VIINYTCCNHDSWNKRKEMLNTTSCKSKRARVNEKDTQRKGLSTSERVNETTQRHMTALALAHGDGEEWEPWWINYFPELCCFMNLYIVTMDFSHNFWIISLQEQRNWGIWNRNVCVSLIIWTTKNDTMNVCWYILNGFTFGWENFTTNEMRFLASKFELHICHVICVLLKNRVSEMNSSQKVASYYAMLHIRIENVYLLGF
jgi:hypothetical protein